MKRFGWSKELGDTLIEVTIALGIVSTVLISATSLAIKASQTSQTAKERTAIANQAQSQMEEVRSFRDRHTWLQFLNGVPSGYFGVINGGGSIPCQVKAPCLHMGSAVAGSSSDAVPQPGGMLGRVSTSWIEISVEPDGATPTQWVDVIVSYGFQTVGGGPDNVGHIKTRLSNLTFTPPPTPGPPPPCPNRGPNLVPNGTFALGAGTLSTVNPAIYGFTTGIPNRGPDTFPDDEGQNGSTPDLRGWGGGFSTLTHPGPVNGPETTVLAFPGDNTVSPAVPPATTFMYTNPGQALTDPKGQTQANNSTFQGVLWQTTLTVQPDTQYDFSGYFANVLTQHYIDNFPGAVFPLIEISVDNNILQAPTQIPFNNSAWVPIHLMFKTAPGQTQAFFTIKDFAGQENGDDFAMTALGVNKCL